MPFRALAEALRAEVAWDETTRAVTMHGGPAGKTVEVVMRVDNDIARIGETPVRLDVAPRLVDDRVYVPLRFVAEALDVTVDWHAGRQLVEVRTGR